MEGSVVARLLGLRLLVIDARLVLAPAELKNSPPTAPGTPRVRHHAVGARLAAAQRLLDADSS